jgi:tetratricopeptide (TPR) repeat protein
VSARNQPETLEASALISLVRQQPELEYWFRHVLVQEAAYTSLLHADRRRLHRIVAQTLEHLFADRLDGYAALLAQHFHEAADDEKTVEYAARAGDAAARSFAHPEARGHYARALEALSRLPAAADNGRRQVDTILKQVGVSLRAEGPEQSLARLQDAEALLNRFADQGEPTHSDRLRRARVHFWMGHACVHGGRMREALGYMQQVLDEAQTLGDEDLLATPAAVIGRALAMQGQFAKGAALLSRALPPLQKVANWPEWIITSGILAFARAAQGDVRAGIALCSGALARAEQLEYATGIGQAHISLALIYSISRDAQRMAAESGAALELAERVHDRLISYLAGSGLSLALSRLDRPVEAAAQLAKVDSLVQVLGASLAFADWFAAARSEIALRAGNRAEALQLAERAVARARAVRGLWAEGYAQRVWGQALAAVDPPQWDEAEAHMRESLRLLDECGASLEAAQTHVAWAMLRRARGDAAAALEHLGQAARQFEASGVTSELAHARQLMSESQQTI